MVDALSSSTVKVPGATIYFEQRGSGPLLILIPGGPADAGYYATLAEALADSYTVVAYDPRGNSRSVFDDVPVEQDLDVHADDAARLIEALGREAALVFGSSGGAQIGLSLAAKHPQLVRTLVAHEPPCVLVLPDSDLIATGLDEVLERYERDGMEAAMRKFMEVTGVNLGLDVEGEELTDLEQESEAKPMAEAAIQSEAQSEVKSEVVSEVQSEPSAESQPEPSADELASFERMGANMPYFFRHGIKPIPLYRPKVETLRTGSVRVIVGIGDLSAGQLANRTAVELAGELGVEPVTFPGGHDGYYDDPRAFADALHRALNNP